MCAKNNTHMYVARTSNNRVIAAHGLYCCLLPQCEALRTCRSGFPIATLRKSRNPYRPSLGTSWYKEHSSGHRATTASGPRAVVRSRHHPNPVDGERWKRDYVSAAAQRRRWTWWRRAFVWADQDRFRPRFCPRTIRFAQRKSCQEKKSVEVSAEAICIFSKSLSCCS